MKKSLLFLALAIVVGALSPAFGKKCKQAKMNKEQFIQLVTNSERYSNAGNYKQSEADIKNACQVYHKSNYYYVLSQEQISLGNYKKAYLYLDSAISIHSSRAYVDMQMLRVAQLQIMSKFKPEAAILWLDKYLSENPGSSDAFFARAEAHHSLKNWDLAVEDYRKTINMADTARVAHERLAKIWIGLEKNKEAMDILNCGVDRFPDFAELYKLRSNLYQKMGEGRKAVDDMLKYAQVNEQISLGHFSQTVKENPHYIASSVVKMREEVEYPLYLDWIRLRAYTTSSLYLDAVVLAESMTEENEYYARELGECYYFLGLYEEALQAYEYYDRDYSYSSQDIKAYVCGVIGDIYMRLGQDAKADESYAKAYNENGGYYYLHARGMTHIRMNDTIGAMRYFKAALELQPTDSLSLFFRGVLYKSQGRQDLAEADFRKVLSVSPSSVNSVMVHAYLGDRDRAFAITDSLLKVDPYDYNAHYGAACLYSYYNETAPALSHLRKTIECGYRDFRHIEWDFDLENIRQLPEFKALIEEFKQKPLYKANCSILRGEQDEVIEEEENYL